MIAWDSPLFYELKIAAVFSVAMTLNMLTIIQHSCSFTSYEISARVQYKSVLSSLPEGSMDYLLPTKTWPTCSYSALETTLAFLNLCSNKPWLLWRVAGAH